MESWRLVWRKAFGVILPTDGLEALAVALRTDDPRLVQGQTTTPPPLMSVQDWPCEAADALGFCGWQGNGLKTVGEVEEFFAKACFDADNILGEPASCRWFLMWFDDTPRDEMRRKLLAEVELTLVLRRVVAIDLPDFLATALGETPDDRVLHGAIADYHDEHGRTEAAARHRRLFESLSQTPR